MNEINWSEIDWDDLVPRLLLYARYKLRRRPKSSTLLGASEEDFVSQAIEKTISGVRRWENEEVSLLDHLMGVVSSDIYNENRKNYMFFENDNSSLENIVDERTPEDNLVYLDLENDLKKFREYVGEKDKELHEYLLLASVYELSSKEIEKHMDIVSDKIYQFRRRLRRLANQWILNKKDINHE